jgi:plasmid stabilization system protein ParE
MSIANSGGNLTFYGRDGRYLILFTVIDADALIVRVLHGARDARRALEDEPTDDER